MRFKTPSETENEGCAQRQPASDLSALVRQAQTNPAAFATLYERFVKPVYRYLYRRTGDPAEAEELTAQTFFAALEALPRYREQGYFAAWLFTIARSKMSDEQRVQRRQASIEQWQAVSGMGDLWLGLAKDEEIAQVSRLIGALDEDEQELLRLRFVADLTFAEIAIVLQKKPDTVKKALYRLFARLQAALEEDHA